MRTKTSGYQPVSFRMFRDTCVWPVLIFKAFSCSTEMYAQHQNSRLDTITYVPVVYGFSRVILLNSTFEHGKTRWPINSENVFFDFIYFCKKQIKI